MSPQWLIADNTCLSQFFICMDLLLKAKDVYRFSRLRGERKNGSRIERGRWMRVCAASSSWTGVPCCPWSPHLLNTQGQLEIKAEALLCFLGLSVNLLARIMSLNLIILGWSFANDITRTRFPY